MEDRAAALERGGKKGKAKKPATEGTDAKGRPLEKATADVSPKNGKE